MIEKNSAAPHTQMETIMDGNSSIKPNVVQTQTSDHITHTIVIKPLPDEAFPIENLPNTGPSKRATLNLVTEQTIYALQTYRTTNTTSPPLPGTKTLLKFEKCHHLNPSIFSAPDHPFFKDIDIVEICGHDSFNIFEWVKNSANLWGKAGKKLKVTDYFPLPVGFGNDTKSWPGYCDMQCWNLYMAADLLWSYTARLSQLRLISATSIKEKLGSMMGEEMYRKTYPDESFEDYLIDTGLITMESIGLIQNAKCRRGPANMKAKQTTAQSLSEFALYTFLKHQLRKVDPEYRGEALGDTHGVAPEDMTPYELSIWNKGKKYTHLYRCCGCGNYKPEILFPFCNLDEAKVFNLKKRDLEGGLVYDYDYHNAVECISCVEGRKMVGYYERLNRQKDLFNATN